MQYNRIALRFLSVILVASAVACGGTPEDVETGGPTVEERKAYTVAQYQKQLATENPQEAMSVQTQEEVSAMYIGTYCSEDMCCTSTGYCCWWYAPGQSPICHY